MELVGLKEIAEMLGVTTSRAHQLAATTDFPTPEAEISAGRIWRREDVEAWARQTGRLTK
ncbi:MAG: DNA-binding protein [Actinomycetota bacterium]|nr:DNA-binding protein [Actinomycetota bacterium]